MPHLMIPSEELDAVRSSPAGSDFTAKVLPFRQHQASPSRSDVTNTQTALRRVEQDLEPLRRQVTSIIDEILAGNGAAEEPVRESLRLHVARNPGEPERALLKHLLSAPSVSNDPD
ncbi:MAG: hypothetical protein ABIO34_10590 [Arthrobacter oryzae]